MTTTILIFCGRCVFLFQDKTTVEELRYDIQRFRNQLFALNSDRNDDLRRARDRLQQSLLRVMCRTERIGMTKGLDAMLVEPSRMAALHPNDLDQAALADGAGRAVGAREPIEYWKSSPYLLNFLKHYDLRRRIDKVVDTPPAGLLDALREADGHLLESGRFEEYRPIDPASPRMRVLFQDTLDKGMWRLLWMPPALPYSEPSGAYADVGEVTKALVFSAWNVVPDAISAICSYEAERRMIEAHDGPVRYSELYDRLRPLLRFAKGPDGRLTGMPVIAWLLPSPTLATTVDPLALALEKHTGKPPRSEDVLDAAESRCQKLVRRLPRGGPGSRPDERWYWAAPALLEKDTNVISWVKEEWVAAEDDHDPGKLFRDHLVQFRSAAAGALDLGPQPDDLARVLAELALAAPGICALRALRRVAPTLRADEDELLSAAARIASGFRMLYNLPQTIGLLSDRGEGSYWRRTLQYGMEGNLQAVLDEQVHVLVEQPGLADHRADDLVRDISKSLAKSLSIRTAQIRIDELRAEGEAIETSHFNTRCRFALRFGDLRDDRDSTIARADAVREAFNSPFRPFVLASTSIGQEGLDFHTWCHAVVHWNLPSNPVDLEQREGRVHRYKGHAVRKNIAEHYGLAGLREWDGSGNPWDCLFPQSDTGQGRGQLRSSSLLGLRRGIVPGRTASSAHSPQPRGRPTETSKAKLGAVPPCVRPTTPRGLARPHCSDRRPIGCGADDEIVADLPATRRTLLITTRAEDHHNLPIGSRTETASATKLQSPLMNKAISMH